MTCYDERMKFAQLQKKYAQNLTRCKIFKSDSDTCFKVDLKSDFMWRSWFEIWQGEKILIENHAFNKNFFIQNHAFNKNFFNQNHAF